MFAVAMYMVSRFLIGIGLTVASTAAPMMVAELAHPNTRTTMTALYNTLWYFGVCIPGAVRSPRVLISFQSIVAAWTTYGSWRIDSTWSWRLPTLLQALPACINLIAIWWLPESPRWLVGKDRRQEALDILTKYHGNGDADSPLVAAEFTEICETLQLELTGQRSWSELFRTKANRHRTFLVVCCALFPQWSGNGLISYYIAPILRSIGITSQANITLINGILQIWNMLIAITGACLVARVGRRPLFLTSTGGMLAVMIAWTISGSVFDKTKSTATGAGILVCVILFATSYNICWNPLAVAYPVEILPFSIRAKGIALLMGATKGATFFNQFVNPIGLAELGWRYYIVYCVWLSVVLTVVYYTFPETKVRHSSRIDWPLLTVKKNHTLEDTADIFEKKHLPWSRDKSERSSVVQCVEIRNTSTKAT